VKGMSLISQKTGSRASVTVTRRRGAFLGMYERVPLACLTVF